MRAIKTAIWAMALAASTTAVADPAGQTLTAAGSQASMAGPEQFFTGDVRVDPLFPGTDAINASGAYVTFEPGARSAWHTHPKGQHIVVTQGVGLTQEWGKPIRRIKPGDVVWCPPGVKHWHGAAAETAMTHLVVTGQDADGENVNWMEKVTDSQYAGRPNDS
ncbi:cupin domain-containing protein [Alloalcanivorax marinus]|uniref:(R)-mandelonitrile lyase n=1 Tax=Alloalcanivorax marinus TaxID=1177169 RepID=UPI001EF92906|nr:cupin domain-containing protein [Alloalcanivorax marinus]MBM7335469.1 cupin domain-containing protein [Alloalcanivorax marinus]